MAELQGGLLAQLDAPDARARISDLGARVTQGALPPVEAARQMLDWLRQPRGNARKRAPPCPQIG